MTGSEPGGLTFGQVATKYRFATLRQLEEALARQEARLARGEPVRLGAIFVEMGVLSPEDVPRIVALMGRPGAYQRVAGYEVHGLVGRGGMGSVFRARPVGVGRGDLVALKILFPRLSGDPRSIRRFMREVRAAALLTHPNIVAGLDVGRANGLYYLVMEYVRGESLANRLKRHGPLSEAAALGAMARVADAVAHAAAVGLIHGDVKPANVLLARDGTPKLCDLGLARTIRAEQGGKPMGTPKYVAPEVLSREATVDARADVYSIGATLHHALVGRPPFRGSSQEILRAHLETPPPSVREANAGISGETESLILRMLEKEPARRPTPEEAARALEVLAEAGAPPDLEALDAIAPAEPGGGHDRR